MPRPVIAAARRLAVLSPSLRVVIAAAALAAFAGTSFADPVLPKSNDAKRCSARKVSKAGGPIKGCHWYIAGVLAKRYLATTSSR